MDGLQGSFESIAEKIMFQCIRETKYMFWKLSTNQRQRNFSDSQMPKCSWKTFYWRLISQDVCLSGRRFSEWRIHIRKKIILMWDVLVIMSKWTLKSRGYKMGDLWWWWQRAKRLYIMYSWEIYFWLRLSICLGAVSETRYVAPVLF